VVAALAVGGVLALVLVDRDGGGEAGCSRAIPRGAGGSAGLGVVQLWLSAVVMREEQGCGRELAAGTVSVRRFATRYPLVPVRTRAGTPSSCRTTPRAGAR
jgi:hypothetical protein